MNCLASISSLILFVVFLIFSCKNKEKKQGIIHEFLKIGDTNREYIVYLPKDLSANSPLIFVCHGYSGSAESIMNETQMNLLADTNGFAICYPQGLTDKNNKTFWEVGYSFTQDRKVDDVAFLTKLVTHLQEKYNLSKENTFATGMSNGGDMSIMLACNAPTVFKAVAPVCGSLMKKVYNSCGNSIPIPICMINSTSDKITWWEGDMADRQGYGAYLPVLATHNFFVKKNHCTQFSIDTLPNINFKDSSFVVCEKHTNGMGGNQVWLYSIVNGNHNWAGHSGNMDISASKEVWAFFKQFIR